MDPVIGVRHVVLFHVLISYGWSSEFQQEPVVEKSFTRLGRIRNAFGNELGAYDLQYWYFTLSFIARLDFVRIQFCCPVEPMRSKLSHRLRRIQNACHNELECV